MIKSRLKITALCTALGLGFIPCFSMGWQVRLSPSETLASPPAGRWKVEFANGVKQDCVIDADGTASVVEPQRASSGPVITRGPSSMIVFKDERVERWTPVGDRFVVEHWCPDSKYPTGAPELGIADRIRQ